MTGTASAKRSSTLHHSLAGFIARRIRDGGPIYDLGAGIRPCILHENPVCVEPHWEYADVLEENGFRVIRKTAMEAIPDIPSGATVLLLDVIEHMEKDEGKTILKALEKFRRAVIYTPDGFEEQSQKGEEKDPWGYDGWHWQTHRSGWTADEFPGWDVERLKLSKTNRGLLCFR